MEGSGRGPSLEEKKRRFGPGGELAGLGCKSCCRFCPKVGDGVLDRSSFWEPGRALELTVEAPLWDAVVGALGDYSHAEMRCQGPIIAVTAGQSGIP